jgi:single-strand DNA-binding protein
MHALHFTGRIAAAPALTGADDRAVCRFTLISNEYAGKDDDSGERKERAVSVQFTAFQAKAEAIAKHCCKGDQLAVIASIQNNNWKDNDGNDHYDFNFIVDKFEFGAPGEIKRARLNKAQNA